MVRALRGGQEGGLAEDLGRARDAGREERPGRRGRRCSSRPGSASGWCAGRSPRSGSTSRVGADASSPCTPSSRGDGGNRSLRVTCAPATCKAEITADDGRRTTEFPHPGETAEQAEAARLAARTCKPVSGAQLQSDDLRVKRMTSRYAGRTRVGGAGVEVPVSIVEEKEDGDRVAPKVLVSDDGRILETRVGDGMVIRLEPAEIARRLDVVDLFTTLRVPLPAPLPREVPMSITFALQGLPRGFDLDDPRQRAVPGAGGETLLTVTAREFGGPDAPRGKPAPRGDADQATTIEIDWEHPSIRDLSAAVAGSTTGAWATARKLSRAVHDRLDKVYGQSRDRASEILKQGKGDCTEHTRLFVALSRAAGIRAREVKGLVFANYGQGGPGALLARLGRGPGGRRLDRRGPHLRPGRGRRHPHRARARRPPGRHRARGLPQGHPGRGAPTVSAPPQARCLLRAPILSLRQAASSVRCST